MDNIVKRTMQGIRRTLGVKQRRVTALVKDDLLEMMVHVDQQMPIRAARDKALFAYWIRWGVSTARVGGATRT